MIHLGRKPLYVFGAAFAAVSTVAFQNCNFSGGSFSAQRQSASAHSSSFTDQSGDTKFYVSTTGDDTATGTFDAPFKTVARALAAVAQARKTGSATAATHVVLRDGTYYVSSPLTIDSTLSSQADQSLVIERYPGERPVLSGGRRVTGWARLNPGSTPAIWVAAYPDPSVDLGNFSHQLWIGNQWAVKARYPKNASMFSHPEWQNQNYWMYTDRTNFDSATQQPPQDRLSRIEVGNDDWNQIANWNYSGNGEVIAYDLGGFETWSGQIAGIGAITRELIFTNKNSNYKSNPGNRYFVSNVFEQLTDVNEWFLDKKNRRVFFIPPAGIDPNTLSITVSGVNAIVNIGGSEAQPVQNVRIESIEFSGTSAKFCEGNAFIEDAAVLISNARNISVERSRFRNLAGSGIIAGHNAVGVTINQNVFSDLGNSAALAYGHPAYGPVPSQIDIHGNFISRVGLIKIFNSALLLYGASNSRIANNQMDHVLGNGIALFSMPGDKIVTVKNVVSGNELAYTNLAGADGGAIYIVGNSGDYSAVPMNSKILSNRVLHAVGAASRADGVLLSPHGATGIYIDNQSSGNLVKLNVVSDSSHSSVKINNGSNNWIHQNLLANSETAVDDQNSQVEAYAFGLKTDASNFFSGNQFYLNAVANTGTSATAPVWVFPDFAGPNRSFSWIDGNLYWKQAVSMLETYPLFSRFAGGSQALQNWRDAGIGDLNSMVARNNPGFFIDTDGRTVFGNAAGGWSGAVNYGPSPTQLTGLRAESTDSPCIASTVGSQYSPVLAADADSVYSCLAQ